ncbi:MAG: ABC transporter permease [Chloroflexota bacterium]
MRHELNAVLAIAHRDLLKFLRDRGRLISTFIFPIIFIAILGSSFQSNLGGLSGFDFLAYTFTGVLGQTLFQSATDGVISLIDDRENDFSQEMFVSPISRYSIVLGKICGESLVALSQGIGVVLFGLIMGVQISPSQVAALVPVALVICLFGGSFGVLIMSNLSSRRLAQQIFPFVMLPQFFLAGVFNPIKVLPLPLDILSHISPMRYAVDLARGAFYTGQQDYSAVVLLAPAVNLAIMAGMFALFLGTGTFLFVRRERSR